MLIHGFRQSWTEWRDQMGPLSKNHTVIAVDLRGAGNSEVTKSGYQKAQMAGDVHELSPTAHRSQVTPGPLEHRPNPAPISSA
ncbi:alpha/beta fold hydrolase [Streptomyces sp. NPDC094472]|uniref:alpha/beta fold hydrolase n=1 Tax=Streptomyces sp. NPDC094472 TaxID=3155080 RepID=UPI0033213B1B